MSDPSVAETVSAYLAAVDAEAPGLVEGLYLVGSVALGDFRPGASDLDYLAVTADRPGPAAVAALARAHHRLRQARPRPYFDGAYVTWADLARDPATVPAGPGSHEGRFAADAGERGPVEWHTLARYGVAKRGPAPADLTVWADADRLAAWTDGNLDRYWGRLLDRCARLPSRGGWWSASRYAAVWGSPV